MVSAESQAAMDAAKKAVMEFMSRNGRHNTTVHERVAPAIYHETISRHVHEELVTVIEKEFTQDHYHTSVQPITDSETAEEQHHHNNLPVEDRHFEHDDIDDRDSRLASEREKFKDETYHVNGEHTQNIVPTVTGEHIHHHVHEIIQPVVNKMTIEPHIIHSTVLIREIHHNASKHHILSALPPVTMAEFKRQGGVLVGREERWDSFEGEPRSVGGVLGTPHTATTGSGAANDQPTQSVSTSFAPSAPERRSSLAQPQPQPQPHPQQPAPDTNKPLPTPSAQAVTEARKHGEGGPAAQPPPNDRQNQPAASQPAPSTAPLSRPSQPVQQQQQGRWSLLPMHLARSAGEGQPGHQPIRAPLRVPQAQQQQQQVQQQQQQGNNEGRAGSVARGAGQGQGQGQGEQQQQGSRRGS